MEANSHNERNESKDSEKRSLILKVFLCLFLALKFNDRSDAALTCDIEFEVIIYSFD